MSKDENRSRFSKILQAVIIVGGAAMIIFAFLADLLGYGSSGSLGIGQILLLIIGLLFVIAGLLGKRFSFYYQKSATVLLNTIVIIILVELVAIFLGRTLFKPKQAEVLNMPYYSVQEWSNVYWEEAGRSHEVEYEPYVIWKKKPITGDTINFDIDGIRFTPGAKCSEGTYRVFTFGGSTMLGWGSPDWGTIAAYLQADLEKLTGRPVCVVNFGEDGFVSTQSLIKLLMELQADNVPDIVVFYDGINEVIAAHESKMPGAHVTLEKIASRFEGRDSPILTWIGSTRTYSFLEKFAEKMGGDRYQASRSSSSLKSIDSASNPLADSVVNTYLANYELMDSLANRYLFDYFFFFQPHPAIGSKILTEQERDMIDSIDSEISNLAKAIYNDIELIATDYERLWYIADVFDSVDDQIWIDNVGHITPDGNRIVAGEILNAFAELPEDKH